MAEAAGARKPSVGDAVLAAGVAGVGVVRTCWGGRGDSNLAVAVGSGRAGLGGELRRWDGRHLGVAVAAVAAAAVVVVVVLVVVVGIAVVGGADPRV